MTNEDHDLNQTLDPNVNLPSSNTENPWILCDEEWIRLNEQEILITYNQPVLPDSHPDAESEKDVLHSVQVVRRSLEELHLQCSSFSVDDKLHELANRIRFARPSVILNLFEGAANNTVTEVYFAGILEWLDLPFTGSSARTLMLAREKALVKRLLQASGIPTAEFIYLEDEPCPQDPVAWPAIVKPGIEDASVGIDQEAVVTNNRELHDRVDYVRSHYGPSVLIEEFVPGREFQLSLVDFRGTGTFTMLPASEIVFQANDEDRLWPIYSYTAKWDESSKEYARCPIKVGVELPADLHSQLEAICQQTAKVLGVNDYCRLDIRVRPNGSIAVLECNPNPSITSLMIHEALPLLGLDYYDFLGSLLHSALSRHERKASKKYSRR